MKKIYSLISLTILPFIILLILIGSDLYLFTQTQILKAQSQKEQKELSLLQKKEKNLTNLKRQEDKLNQWFSLSLHQLSLDPSGSLFIRSVEKISQVNQATFQTLQFTALTTPKKAEEEETGKKTKAPQEQKKTTVSLPSLPYTLSLVSSFDNFLKIISDLENQSIFTSLNKTTLRWQEDSSVTSSLEGKVYYNNKIDPVETGDFSLDKKITDRLDQLKVFLPQ